MMRPPSVTRNSLRPARAFVTGLALVGIALLLPARTEAHFILDKQADGGVPAGEPACFSVQDSSGAPEKSPPCGQVDTGNPVVPTGIVTAFTPNADGTTTIAITTNEVVFHPGHYRVALAATQAALPPDPAVTVGTTMCGSAAIETVPQGGILADGVVADGILNHTAQFQAPQTVTVTIPAGFECSPQCTLQVMEFMADHPLNPQGGCFYHHCANIMIRPQGVADAGGSSASGNGQSGSGAGAGGAAAVSGEAAGSSGVGNANRGADMNADATSSGSAGGDQGAAGEATEANCEDASTCGTSPNSADASPANCGATGQCAAPPPSSTTPSSGCSFAPAARDAAPSTSAASGLLALLFVMRRRRGRDDVAPPSPGRPRVGVLCTRARRPRTARRIFIARCEDVGAHRHGHRANGLQRRKPASERGGKSHRRRGGAARAAP